tara:strand:- start:79 stop:471 length:393 start_codon:yes stop_codon:yes gene_type:complete
MIKEIVEVEEVFGDKVRIKFNKRQMCSCCRMYNLCGRGENSLDIDDCGFSLTKGDKIEIAIDERKTLLASGIIFLVPAVIFLGALIAFRDQCEFFSFFIGLGFLVMYYLGLKLILRKQGKKFNLKILRKI